MKKSLLFSAFLFIGCSNLFSQINNYKPFPNGSAVWAVSSTTYASSMGGGQGMNYYRYMSTGDTIIGIYNYKKVFLSVSPDNPSNYGPYNFSFGYRNDSVHKKVYYLNTIGGLNKDTLWYDFNLQIGDTLKETFSRRHYGLPERRIVSKIDSIEICMLYHKRFYFDCVGITSTLIEGLGFQDNFIQTWLPGCFLEPLRIDQTDLRTCNINNDITCPDTFDPNGLAILKCNINTYITEHNQKSNAIHLYPNPVTTELKITNSQTTFCDYTIINTIGKLILKGSYTDKESINVSALTNGLYVIELHDKQGNAYQSKFIKQ